MTMILNTSSTTDEMKMFFMREALSMGKLALDRGEIPVGCVIVCGDNIIAKGSNQTNESRNGTRHAEIIAVESLYITKSQDETCARINSINNRNINNENDTDIASITDSSNNNNNTNTNLKAPNTKLNNTSNNALNQNITNDDNTTIANPSLLRPLYNCDLYVTCEPCIMCAAALSKLGKKSAYIYRSSTYTDT